MREGILELAVNDNGTVVLSRSNIAYGKDKRHIMKENGSYIVPLIDLKMFFNEHFFPLVYENVNSCTRAKRTLTGGLMIKRSGRKRENYVNTARFTLEEVSVIKEYL